jgi:hypothetical protein
MKPNVQIEQEKLLSGYGHKSHLYISLPYVSSHGR